MTSALRKEPKIASVELIFILITLFVDGIGSGLSNPILPKLINQFVGNVSSASSYFGIVSTLYALMLFIFSPIQGALSDRLGRKPLLLFSLLGTGLSYLTLALAPNLFCIFIAQLINGATGASLAVVFAYISDVSTPEKRTKSFGLVGAALGIAWVIGPALGGLLSFWGLRVPFLVAAGITLSNLLYGLYVIPESHLLKYRRAFSWHRANPIASLSLLYQSPRTFVLAAIIFCTDLALQCFISTWVLFTTYKFHWSAFQAGLSLALLGLMTAVVQAGMICTRGNFFGERRMLTTALIFSMIGYILYALANQEWMIYGVIILNSFDFLVKPIAQSLLSHQIKPEEQGLLQGALASQTALTAIVGPLLATSLLSYFTAADSPLHLPEAPFLLGAALFLLALRLIKHFNLA